MGCTNSKIATADQPQTIRIGSPEPKLQNSNISAPQRFDLLTESPNTSEEVTISDDKESSYGFKNSKQNNENDFNGAPTTAEQKLRSATLDFLDKKIEKEVSRTKNNRKLTALFLGTGECGKSTVFKQMRLCYGEGFNQFEREQYAKIIWADALRAIRMLVDMCCEELRSEECEPGLHELVLQWLGGLKLGQTPLGKGVQDSGYQQISSDLFGPVDNALINNFMWLFVEQEADDLAFERDFGGRTVESRAVRNAMRLLQSVDLSRDAFLAAEMDFDSKNFLQGHATNGRKKKIKQITDPMELMRNTLEGIVDEYEDENAIESPTNETRGGLADAFKTNGDITEYEEAMMKPKRKMTEIDKPSRILLAAATHLLWETCPDLIKAMVASNQLGLETNAKYFLENVGRFVPPNFLATDEDILRGRIKTVGLSSFEFDLRGTTLVVTDAGGQKVERQRWLHNFDDTSCVLYVANVAAYDQMIDEDSDMTKLDEALNVFQTLSRSHWFRAKSFQLILNKVDILEEKCKKSSFRRIYPSFKGDERDPDQILTFIEKMFEKRFYPRTQGLYVYKTCATDTKMMQFVVSAVSDMILQENLRWAGMF